MKCKYCNREGFVDNKGLATHRRYNKICYNKWIKEKEEIDSKRTKVKCLLCGKMLRNISNTHLKKHSITQQQYKKLFPNAPLFSEGLLDEQKQKREKTIKQRYTKEQIKYLHGKKSILSKEKKYNMPYSEFCRQNHINNITKNPEKYDKIYKKLGKKIKNFHQNMLDEDKQKFNKKKQKKRKKTNFKKYGVEFPQRLDEIKDKVKKTKKEKYGDEYYRNAQKCRKTLFKNYGKYSNFFPHFSLISQELFRKIEQKLDNEKCYYAINGIENKNNEYQVLIGKIFVRFLDFYIQKRKKWIEIDEKRHTNEEVIKKDKKREKEIFGKIKKIELLRISEKEFLENKNKTLQKCLDFIYNLNFKK